MHETFENEAQKYQPPESIFEFFDPKNREINAPNLIACIGYEHAACTVCLHEDFFKYNKNIKNMHCEDIEVRYDLQIYSSVGVISLILDAFCLNQKTIDQAVQIKDKFNKTAQNGSNDDDYAVMKMQEYVAIREIFLNQERCV